MNIFTSKCLEVHLRFHCKFSFTLPAAGADDEVFCRLHMTPGKWDCEKRESVLSGFIKPPRPPQCLNMKMNHFHHRAEGIWWVHLSPPGTATQISPVTPVLFSHRDVFVLWASPWSSLRCWQDMLGPCVLKYSVRKWLRLSCPWVRKEDEEAGYLQPVRSSRAKMVNHWLSSHRRQRSPSYSIIWALHCVALQLWNVRVLLAVMMSTFFSKP